MKFVIGALLFLFNFGIGMACECDSIPAVEKAYKTADLILVAKVVNVEIIYTGESTALRTLNVNETEASEEIQTVMRNSYKRVSLEVKEFLKGKLKNKSQIIYTGIDETECGFDFESDRKYIIYCHYSPEDERVIGRTRIDEKLLFTDHCTRTKKYKKTEVKALQELGV